MIKEIVFNIIFWSIMLWIFRGGLYGIVKDKELPNNFTQFTISYGKTLKIIVMVGLVLFFYLSFASTGTMLWGWELCETDWISTIIMYGFALLCLISFGGIVVWHIEVNNDEIYYRDYIGIKHTYTPENIAYIKETRKHDLIVYGTDKRLFTISDNLVESVYFTINKTKPGEYRVSMGYVYRNLPPKREVENYNGLISVDDETQYYRYKVPSLIEGKGKLKK